MSIMEFEYFTGKNILITGGGGYIAQALIRLLQNVPCTISCLDKNLDVLKNYDKNNYPIIIPIVGDIKNKSLWTDVLEKIDIVFYFAAQTSVYVANTNPNADIDINVLPILNLLETCRKGKYIPNIIFAGTATEVGLSDKITIDEMQRDNPITIYDIHKLTAEYYIKFYARESIIKGAILRLANVYGPGPLSSSAERGFLNQMIRKAIKNEPLTIYCEGNFIRDYIFITDVARAFLLAASNIENTNQKHFYIGSGRGCTIADAINLISERVAQLCGNKVPIVEIDYPTNLSPIEYRNFIANTSRFSDATGWIPGVELTTGIDYTIQSFLNLR